MSLEASPPKRPTQDAGGSAPGSVRPARFEDLDRIAEIHIRAFGEAFLARMGRRFLRVYYREVLEFDGGVLLVAERDSEIAGFVAGFTHPSDFYQHLLKRKWRLAWPVIHGVIRSPRLLARVIGGVKFVERSKRSVTPGNACELSSIAVDPTIKGGGLGKMLLDTFLQLAAEMGSEFVYLTTDTDNMAANALYRHNGFELSQTFNRGRNRVMNEYVYYFPPAMP